MEVRRNVNWCSAFEYPFVVTDNGSVVKKFTYESHAHNYVRSLKESDNDEMKKAEVEIVTTNLAHCPYCDAEHEVSFNDDGVIDCVCENKFSWTTI